MYSAFIQMLSYLKIYFKSITCSDEMSKSKQIFRNKGIHLFSYLFIIPFGNERCFIRI